MIQDSLFEESDETDDLSPTIVCRHCNQEKPREMFRLYRRATGDRECRSTSCKDCQKYNASVVARIKETAPPVSDNCDCCGKTDTKLVLDHCYHTEQFRGWLCSHCNLSIGLLGDDEDGILRALSYLRKK